MRAKLSKWYHYGEPQIIDVTSFDDIDKALDDGRFRRIVEEHEKYTKETEATGWHRTNPANHKPTTASSGSR
jgi:hypothetical protein